MTIFLHIGTHKTGTTAIQRHLGRHANFYASQGLWYPMEAELRNGGHASPNHLNIARSLDCSNKQKHYNETQLQEMAQAIVSKAQNFRHTIISAEAFWRIGFGSTEADNNPNQRWDRKAKSIDHIRRLFGDKSDMEVVCVIRERNSYLQRHYSELILATLYRKSIQKFLKSFHHLGDYQRQLTSWQQHFPVRALSYESLCEQHNITHRFLHSLVGPIPQPPETGEQKIHFNIGHPIPCVLYKRYLNGMDGLPRKQLTQQYNKGRRRFAKISNTSAVASLQRINSWLTPKEIRILRRSFLSDDDLIRERFCPEFVSGSTGKEVESDSSIKPLTREAHYLALGWMLSKKKPNAGWFTPTLSP
jgi:hypothetical protein